MKTYLLMAAAVVLQPAASVAQTTASAGASFQQAQALGTETNAVIRMAPAGTGNQWIAGKPYAATAVTHTVQLLADGSQIERSQSQMFYRDEQGRERREQSEGKFVQIVDPVAGLLANLDVAAKTARTQEMAGRPALSKPIVNNPQFRSPFEIESEIAKRNPNLAVEDLGTRFINGVEAQGARVTNTIPLGAVGNNRELKQVHEQWASKQLGVQVKSVNTDPRFGTTTYELTNIVLGAPDPSLFKIPSDYTIIPLKPIQNQN